MKKLILLALIISILSCLSCNFSVLAVRDCQACNNVTSVSQNELEKDNKRAACDAEKYSGKVTRVVRAIMSTGIAFGTFSGVKILSSILSASGSKLVKFVGKTFIGVAGTCIAVASVINSTNDLGEDLMSSLNNNDYGNVNRFCFGLNMVNVAASFYTLKYIFSGQIFSGNSLKISIGL